MAILTLGVSRPYVGVWRHLDNPGLGFMNTFSDMIRREEISYAGLLADLRGTPTIFLASDYGGMHSGACYQSLSFLLVNPENLGRWDGSRCFLRDRMKLGSRRLSYKALNDRRKRQALLPFLQAANLIPGILMTVLIDRCVPAVFSEGQRDESKSIRSEFFPDWSPAVIERSLRVVHLVSLFLAGLSTPGQDVFWFTDEDDIVANEMRLRQLVGVFARVSSHYLTHGLRHFRLGTARSDTGRRDLEDLLAIADLTAGALQEAVKKQGIPNGAFWLRPAADLPAKTREILDWFSDDTTPLKRLVYVIDKTPGSRKLRLTSLRFHGTNDSVAFGR
jgi:hypothetical protein